MNSKKAGLNNKGFSLIELLIAIALFAIIIIPIFSSFITSARINRDARQLMIETDIAQTIMEGFANKSYEDLKEIAGDLGLVNLSGNNALSTIENNYFNSKEVYEHLSDVAVLQDMSISINEIQFDGASYAARDLVSNNAVVVDMCHYMAVQTALAGYSRSSVGYGSPCLCSYSADGGNGLFFSYCGIEEGGYFYIAVVSVLPAAATANDDYFTYNVNLCLYDITALASYDSAGIMGMYHPCHDGYESTTTPVLTMETGIRNK
ncbi:MAG: prepilin-type N-terminal cleavage/methylation domain-containing protein [Lachnospiraceae bacterium]|nr:prepilin-type N-terminal cleavage/methylation domain-containing protein [Lachnospiraceae bacterium]